MFEPKVLVIERASRDRASPALCVSTSIYSTISILKLIYFRIKVSLMFERKLFKSKNGQWRITIPPQIVDDLNLNHGDKLDLESVKRGTKIPHIRINKIQDE